MEAVIVIALYLFVIFGDFLPGIKEKQKKEIWVYSIVLLLSFCMMILVSIGVELPSLSKPINSMIENLFGIKV